MSNGSRWFRWAKFPSGPLSGGSAVPQLARLASDISFSGGTWIFSSGTEGFAMCDETISDQTTTEVASPSTVATHTVEMKFGASWNGTPLARPIVNTGCMLRVDVRFITGAVDCNVYLYEGATLRDTWAIGTLGASTYVMYRRELAGAVIDAITDFTNLRVRVDFVVGTSSRRGVITYASLLMPPTNAVSAPGLYSIDFATAGLSLMPRCFEAYTINTSTPAPPLVGTSVDASANTFVSIYTCYALALPADSYAEATIATGYDTTKILFGAFIRQAKNWVTPGTDSVRYDLVNNLVATPQHDLKYDGGASATLASVVYATVPNMAAGDRSQTRGVGTVISGRKNGTEILTFDDAARPALGAGYAGFVLAPFNGTPWVGISKFEMGSA